MLLYWLWSQNSVMELNLRDVLNWNSLRLQLIAFRSGPVAPWHWEPVSRTPSSLRARESSRPGSVFPRPHAMWVCVSLISSSQSDVSSPVTSTAFLCQLGQTASDVLGSTLSPPHYTFPWADALTSGMCLSVASLSGLRGMNYINFWFLGSDSLSFLCIFLMEHCRWGIEFWNCPEE